MTFRIIALSSITVALMGCGGDDSGQGVLKVSGGSPDPASQIAEENRKKSVDPNDPTYQKMATPDKRNTSRDPGVTSGGSSGTAILD